MSFYLFVGRGAPQKNKKKEVRRSLWCCELSKDSYG
jgi:hypothetical protein